MAPSSGEERASEIQALRNALQQERTKSARLEKELAEALEQQAATSEILRAISDSPADIQPVFEAIADSALRLFGAWSAVVFRYEAGLIRAAAARGGLPGSSEAFMERHQAPRCPTEESPRDRAVRTGTVQHIVDVDTDPSLDPGFRDDARMRGYRSSVAVPMLREGDAIGVIAVTRAQVGGFVPAEIELLQTFADQAAIAIENARLLSELQAKNADLTEALEQQTATSEILRVIAGSPTDLQPVLDTVAKNAARVCGAFDAVLVLVEGTSGPGRCPLRTDCQRPGQNVPAQPRLGHGPGDHRPAADPCS